MALTDVPQSGQTLNDTRNPIRNNFNTINAAFLVDHVEYNIANQGFHNKVTFPAQNPTPLFNGLNGLWSELYTTTTKPEIWVNTAEVVPVNSMQYPITASILRVNPAPAALTAGWTYLPSGMILKWSSNVTANGQATISFPVSANIPVFTTCMTVIPVIADGGAGDVDCAIRLTGVNPTNFSVYGSPRTTTGAKNVTFTYYAIGY